MNKKKLTKFTSKVYNPAAKTGRIFQLSESGQIRKHGESTQFNRMWTKTTGKDG